MNKKLVLIPVFIMGVLIFFIAGCDADVEYTHAHLHTVAYYGNDEFITRYYGKAEGIEWTATEDAETIIESGLNYRIIKVGKDAENDVPKFRYEVFSNYGRVVREGIGWRVPTFRNINENLLKISIGVGTGIQMVQFYSAKNDAMSEVFNTPILITDELMGLLRWYDANVITLVVRNIFDKEIYYNEFLLENFAAVANPADAIIRVEYLGSGVLEIIYLSGESFGEEITIFEL